MIDPHNFRAMALHQGFAADSQEVSDVLQKIYVENGDQAISAALATISAAPAQKQAVLQKYL